MASLASFSFIIFFSSLGFSLPPPPAAAPAFPAPPLPVSFGTFAAASGIFFGLPSYIRFFVLGTSVAFDAPFLAIGLAGLTSLASESSPSSSAD
jgi:hypothetical protein